MRSTFAIFFLLIFSLSITAQQVHRDTWELEGVTQAKQISKIPDFARYTDVKEKKKAFFEFIRPMVKEENQILQNEYLRISELSDGEDISASRLKR